MVTLPYLTKDKKRPLEVRGAGLINYVFIFEICFAYFMGAYMSAIERVADNVTVPNPKNKILDIITVYVTF